MTLTESSPRLEIESSSLSRGESYGPTREELAMYELRDLLHIRGDEASRKMLDEMEKDLRVGKYDIVKYLRAYVRLVERNGKV